MALFSAAFAATLLSTPATAGRMPMDSLNRVHAGVAVSDNATGLGAVGGMDSRLTRLIFVDIGGFWSGGAQSYDSEIDPDTQEPGDWYTMRHGLYAAPGLRIPHRYSDGLNWDVIGRAGFAALWISDVSQRRIPGEDALMYSEPALLLGADVLLRYDKVGVRMAAKGYGWRTYSPVANVESGVVRPQFTLEGVVQF